MADRKHIQDLAVRTVVAMAAGASGLAGPDAGAAATALTPLVEEALGIVLREVGSRRRDHAAETLADAAEAAGVITDDDFAEFLKDALSDERRQELLARALIIAQDSALRGKRRAIGRSIAAGIADAGTRVDEELVFLRAIDDLDAPHFRLLRMMTEISPAAVDPHAGIRAWRVSAISFVDYGLRETAQTLLTGLDRQGLIASDGEAYPHSWKTNQSEQGYQVTDFGYRLLKRLEKPPNEEA
jgi:hypothetical protein